MVARCPSAVASVRDRAGRTTEAARSFAARVTSGATESCRNWLMIPARRTASSLNSTERASTGPGSTVRDRMRLRIWLPSAKAVATAGPCWVICSSSAASSSAFWVRTRKTAPRPAIPDSDPVASCWDRSSKLCRTRATSRSSDWPEMAMSWARSSSPW